MNIKLMRERAEMSQYALAKAMKLNQASVARWETGIANPSADKLPKLASVLGCSISDLFADEADSAVDTA